MGQQEIDSSRAALRLPGRALSVLVADDERDTVLTLRELLRDAGHMVHGVYSGDTVMPAVRTLRPDAVILDIELPGMSGYAVAREIRALYYGEPGPLLIAISGKWNKGSDRILAGLVGFDHYLMKPCDPKQVLALLASLRGQLPPLQRPDTDATIPFPS